MNNPINVWIYKDNILTEYVIDGLSKYLMTSEQEVLIGHNVFLDRYSDYRKGVETIVTQYTTVFASETIPTSEIQTVIKTNWENLIRRANVDSTP